MVSRKAVRRCTDGDGLHGCDPLSQVDARSGDALFSFDDSMAIIAWNDAAARLTGIRAADALGRPCWSVLAGVDDHGNLFCHSGCAGARLAREGWPVARKNLLVRRGNGRVRTIVTTIALPAEGRYFHVLTPSDRARPLLHSPRRSVRLTQRQREVLGLIAEGLPAKSIAGRLSITLPTVRHHIRSILLALGAHSQVEAIATARSLELI